MYPLPRDALAKGIAFVDHTIARDDPDYAVHQKHRLASSETETAPPPSVRVALNGANLEVAFVWPGDCGQPRRRGQKSILAPGAWARVRYNGRFTAWDDPWYEDHVVNVAFNVVPRRSPFRGDPAFELDARVNLW